MDPKASATRNKKKADKNQTMETEEIKNTMLVAPADVNYLRNISVTPKYEQQVLGLLDGIEDEPKLTIQQKLLQAKKYIDSDSESEEDMARALALINKQKSGENGISSTPQDQKFSSSQLKKKQEVQRLAKQNTDKIQQLNLGNTTKMELQPLHVDSVERISIPEPTVEQTLGKSAIQTKHRSTMTFSQLEGNEVNFYLLDVYSLGTTLYLTAILENGTRTIFRIRSMNRTLYFVVKGNDFSEAARRQVESKLAECGLKKNTVIEPVRMKYVFEIEGIPKGERCFYKVTFPFVSSDKNLPKPDWEGEYNRFIIGTTYAPLELFIIQNQIKGPSWLCIKKATEKEGFLIKPCSQKAFTRSNVLGLEMEAPLNVEAPEKSLQSSLKVPELRVAAISLKYLKPEDLKQNKKLLPDCNEPKQPYIYCISVCICQNYNIEAKPTNPAKESVTYCLREFGRMIKANSNLRIFDSEDQLLSAFVTDMNRFDPDVLVLHDVSTTLGALIDRLLKYKKYHTWLSRICSGDDKIPSSWSEKKKFDFLTSGRLVVDTYVHTKDQMRLVDYSLPFLAQDLLKKKLEALSYPLQVERAETKLREKELILHTQSEAEITFDLMNHIQIVQMSLQMTNICGYVWKKTLQLSRAERNQYLLMHRCWKEGIIIPDNYNNYKADENELDDEEPKAARNKYEGGFVIDPEVGLHSSFVMLLDFNSLYPSIIRQYNICFSVIKRPCLPISHYLRRKKKGKQIISDTASTSGSSMEIQQAKEPEEDGENFENPNFKVKVPEPAMQVREKWGFLPNLIDYIVNKRKEYKKKMAKATPEKYLVFDTIQKAYKLVANSIYGCLGFERSRFFAKDLAALITEMGRDALGKARQIVEENGFRVIYGDTDSLMIKIEDIGEDKTEVQRIRELNGYAKTLKQKINEGRKTLEIDIDGIFKPLLLLRKKKYVAMKLKNFDEVLERGVEPRFEMELKGIQAVKRDGCHAAKEASKQLIKILLESKSEDIEKNVYQFFRNLKTHIEAEGQKSHLPFLLTKFLNKSVKEYKGSAENAPHVKVAKDLIKEGHKEQSLVHHAITYVIVKREGQESIANKAVSLGEYERSRNPRFKLVPLELDIQHYYKPNEIMPPLDRLISSLSQQQKIDRNQCHELFGVEEKYRANIIKENDNSDKTGYEQVQEVRVLTNKKVLDEHLNNALGSLRCLECKTQMPIVVNGVFTFKCTNLDCRRSSRIDKQQPFYPFLGLISNKVQLYMNRKIRQFYAPPGYKCRKCRLDTSYEPMFCCKGGDKIVKTINSAEMHNVTYMLEKVLNSTRAAIENIDEHFKRNNGKDKEKDEFEKIRSILDSTLGESNFEIVSKSFFKKLDV